MVKKEHEYVPIEQLQGYSKQARIEALVRSIPHESNVGFVNGLLQAQDILLHTEPHVIFFPMRGAAPLSWGLEAIADYYDQPSFTHTYLPYGMRLSLDGQKKYSDTTSKNRYQLLHVLYDTQELRWSDDEVERICIVDESKKGHSIRSTVLQTYYFLHNRKIKEGYDFEITVIECIDETYQKPRLALLNLPEVRWNSLKMPMPYIDKENLLPTILTRPPFESEIGNAHVDSKLPSVIFEVPLVEYVENTVAKGYVQQIVSLVLDELQR